MRKDIQDLYISRVLQNSSRGYLIYNQKAFEQQFPGFTYTAEEVANRIANAEVLRGEDRVSKAEARYGVCLVLWGRI